VFIDLETTGVDINQDRIVKIAILKVYPNGTQELKNFYSIQLFLLLKEPQRYIIYMMKMYKRRRLLPK
jgi:DNA polymerase III epsilon subunit-like protein